MQGDALKWWGAAGVEKAAEWAWKRFLKADRDSDDRIEDEVEFLEMELLPVYIAGELREDPALYGYVEHVTKTRFTFLGTGYCEKTVVLCGNSGRVYVPRTWVGKKVKIVLAE